MAEPIDIVKKSLIRRTHSENASLDYGRLPPQAKELEEAVLGAVLIEKDAIEDVIEFVKDEVFYVDAHQRIWRAIRMLYEKSQPIDLLTVTQQLKANGELDSAGGAFYVAQLTNKIGSASNVEYHARIIYEEYIKRQTISISTETIKDAYEDTNDAFEVLERAEKNLSLLSENKFGSEGQTIGSSMREEMNLIEKRMSMEENELTGITSGFHELDRIIGGWQKSDLIIVAGRPSMGKCLKKGTPIIMYDGSVKNVEDIVVGDLLMGVDSAPRKVMSLARGREMMYWVHQKIGMDYGVNESHIISLDKKFDGDEFVQENIVNIEILNYIESPSHLRDNLLGYKYDHLNKKIFGRTPIWIEKDKVDDYYGFTLDQDGLFLLGDGTVTHNTACTLNFARHAAIMGKKSVAVFSLEMSTAQLTQRLISGEAEIANDRIRNGKLNDGEWSRLTSSLDYLASAGIVIDDTPALSIMELKAKARRLKKDHNIELIVIDYIQLMSGSGKGDGNREQEISTISRGLKALAKELNIPVIALSQLSRAVETRGGEKKPILSDLRESGCLVGDTKIHHPKGVDKISDLDGDKKFDIFAYEQKDIKSMQAKKCWKTGTQKVLEMKLTTGHSIKATPNHKFYTNNGWKRLDEIELSDHVALPINFSGENEDYNKDVAYLMGAMLANGKMLKRQVITYTCNPQDIFMSSEIKKIVEANFACSVRILDNRPKYNWIDTYIKSIRQVSRNHRNPFVVFAENQGIYNLKGKDKDVPQSIFSQCKRNILSFLAGLYDNDGSIHLVKGKTRTASSIHYSTSSHKFANSIQILLQMIGVVARVKELNNGIQTWYNIAISGKENMLIFCKDVPLKSKRKKIEIEKIVSYLSTISGGWIKHYTNEEKSLAFVEVLSIMSVKNKFDVYDIEVPVSHNFIANGILAHNSIEQDSDIVIFLYRPEYYGFEQDAEGNSNAGIGYFMISKHRNGELKDIKVGFDGKYTKFKNLVDGGGVTIENHTQQSESSGSSVSNTAVNKKYIDKHREEQRNKKSGGENTSIQQSADEDETPF